MRNPVSHFAYSQSDLDMKRSRFGRNQDHLTTMSAGLLYPLFVDEVYPGDTYNVDVSSLVRMSTPIHPVMGNAYLDLFWFYVPNRIIWDHFREFMGESPEDPYLNPIEYSAPMLVNDGENSGPVPPKSILDYIGIPANTIPDEVNALPVRAFCKIWNEWFRDQNLQYAIDLDTGDSNLVYAHLANGRTDGSVEWWDENPSESSVEYMSNAQHGGTLPPVNKYHDYFTSALKEPQKGDPVPIPLSGFAPVYGTSQINLLQEGFYNEDTVSEGAYGVAIMTDSLNLNLGGNLGSNGPSMYVDSTQPFEGDEQAYFNNLGADLSMLRGVYSTINDLRYAFQLQKFLEADNRGGTRYREILKAHFGVTSPDASLQIPEFLGGKRISINMSQVLQTSATNEVSPQGNTAAYSLTTDRMGSFTKSFDEHGWLFCVGCIRTEHVYQQGIERMFSRKNKFDYYFPEFANISEQPIRNKELFNPRADIYEKDTDDYETLQAAWKKSNEFFGFQEAWAELRYKPNRISGEFRSTFDQSLDIWHYGDFFGSTPVLSDAFMRETRDNIARTLAVTSSETDQFICDFYFQLDTTRCLPLYSIPGLADHH